MKFILILALLLTFSLSAMDKANFKTMYKSFKKESFAGDKINFLKTLDSSSTFTSKQVAKFIKEISFANDKMKALKLLSTKIEDPKNKSEIINVFSFSSDKKKAEKILKNAKPATKTKTVTMKKPLIVNQIGSWNSGQFNSLISKLKAKSFSSDKLKALKSELKGNNAGFKSKQVISLLKALSFSSDMLKVVKILDTRILGMRSSEIVSILNTFSFSSDKLKALKALKDTITDVENKYLILGAFSFGSDKEKARKILATIKTRSLVYGMIRSQNIVFVVDTSGSMEARFVTSQNESLSRLSFVVAEIKKVLKTQMNSNNNFNIIVFNNQVKSWKTKLVKANSKNINDAIKYLDNLSPRGGTNIYDSLKTAINVPNVETVYFLTDGMPTAGAKTDINSIINDLKTWLKGKKVTVNSTAFLIGQHSSDNVKKSVSLMKSISKFAAGVYRGIDD